MATKPPTSETIALTEKKMDMALDDIIKMSKNNLSKAKKRQRQPNKGWRFMKNAAQEKSSKMQRFIDSRSSFRQGVLAQRRSNFMGNQFPLASEAARKAAVAPFGNRPFSCNVVANWKSRVGAPSGQRRAGGNAGSMAKPPQQQQGNNIVPKQRPQTLDSLFANMKEQRLKVLSRKNNATAVQRYRSGQQMPPRGGGRFGN